MYGYLGWGRHSTQTRNANRWQTELRAIMRAVSKGLEIAIAWRERAAQRRNLGTMSDHMLRDIGIDRATARCESSKPFWRF